jgi:hypothetical protein
MDDEGQETELTHVLGLLQAGLEKAEVAITSLLGTIVADNAMFLSELEAALTDAEAVLLAD